MATLADKVFNAMGDHGPREYVNYPTPEENRTPGNPQDVRDLTDYEMELCHWGLTYGIAWAIARTEDPFETPEEVGTRAFKAAEEAWHKDHLPSEVIPIGQPPQWLVALKKAQKAGAV